MLHGLHANSWLGIQVETVGLDRVRVQDSFPAEYISCDMPDAIHYVVWFGLLSTASPLDPHPFLDPRGRSSAWKRNA